MIVLVLVVAGLCAGSFVNALVWRMFERDRLRYTKMPENAKQARLRELSIVRGRSMCSGCGHQLAAKDLVPVASWLLLRGRCRYCGKPIDDTPLAELLVPLMWIVSYIYWPMALTGQGLFQFALWIIFVVAFVALIIYDVRWFLLPDKIVYPAIALAAVQTFVMAAAYHGGAAVVWGALAGAAVVGGLFYVLLLLSGGTWIGGGDVKLGIALGLLAGSLLRGLLLLFVASVAGLIVALPFMVVRKTGRKTMVPFGPFLIVGCVTVQLFGSGIIAWYLGFFQV